MTEQDINIRWEEMNPTNQSVEKSSKQETFLEDGNLYDSLYDELKIKCNPANYLNENYNHEYSTIANNLYAEVIEHKDNINILMKLRSDVNKKLFVTFSTVHIYPYLFEATNPEQYTGENYDSQKFEKLNGLHRIVRENKTNINVLESLYFEVGEILENNIKIYNGRENEIIENSRIEKLKQEKIDRERIEQERIEQEIHNRKEGRIFSIVFVCFFLSMFVLYLLIFIYL